MAGSEPVRPAHVELFFEPPGILGRTLRLPGTTARRMSVRLTALAPGRGRMNARTGLPCLRLTARKLREAARRRHRIRARWNQCQSWRPHAELSGNLGMVFETSRRFPMSSGVACAAPDLRFTGAGDEIRTHDPYLGKVMLYP
uniref:Uncharacterized protein n=1 Tax=Cereibacter sphaeroides (strain ATCC 17025 / ATH 2.4.3) TaxID=349102 RepID=A4WT94_CERS5